MKPPGGTFHQYAHDMLEEMAGASVGMEVDDGDPFEILGGAAEFDKQHQPPPFDVDFFNSFEDDFDDDDVA